MGLGCGLQSLQMSSNTLHSKWKSKMNLQEMGELRFPLPGIIFSISVFKNFSFWEYFLFSLTFPNSFEGVLTLNDTEGKRNPSLQTCLH